ncbi:MAG: PspA/IM30 family protein [Armatimonadetes bacterium]|nr:PspA/IM30 family protein [Armatimonadota bacterium]
MGIFGRIWRLVKGWLLIGVEKAEDPEVILAEAQEAMRREVEKAKESAVQAIAARNQLRNVLQDQVNQANALEAKARAAVKLGDDNLARQLLMEKANLDKSIEGLRAQLVQAEAASEAVKTSIKQMEAQLRQRTAQRLALVAGWKQAKIQESLQKALDGISLESQSEAFTRAEDRIRQLQAQSNARIELAAGNMNAQMQKLEDVVIADQVDAQLAALKAENSPLPSTTTVDPLARLKAEMAGQAAPQSPKAETATTDTEEIQEVGQGGGSGRKLEI